MRTLPINPLGFPNVVRGAVAGRSVSFGFCKGSGQLVQQGCVLGGSLGLGAGLRSRGFGLARVFVR